MKIRTGWCKLRHVHVNWTCKHSPRHDYNEHMRTKRKRESTRRHTLLTIATTYVWTLDSKANKHRQHKQCSTQIHANLVRGRFSSSSNLKNICIFTHFLQEAAGPPAALSSRPRWQQRWSEDRIGRHSLHLLVWQLATLPCSSHTLSVFQGCHV